MRKLKKTLLVLGVLLFMAFLGVFIFLNTLKPSYSGEKTMPGLSQEATVYFDDYGIPHIYAENEADAFKAMGYVHAQDRLWQMELLRRVAKGGLSEVFGKDLVETDKLFLSLGIDEHTKETVSQLDSNTEVVKLTEAYLSGINEFIKSGPTPVEFYLTGLEKEPFTISDVYNAIGYMAFSFAMAHKTDPLLTNIKNKLGEEYINDLAISSDTSTVWIRNHKKSKLDTLSNSLTANVSSALKALPIPQFIGSNSWVLSPEKTRNGKVILANDPHVGFAQPSVWYEAHINTPTFEKYGYYFAGIPFPVLGHDRNLAFGLTMFENDDIDFYFEENHPTDSTKYKTESGWKDYEFMAKTIRVKDEDPVKFTYKKSRHGSVSEYMTKGFEGENPIATSWIYTKIDNEVLDALYQMNHASNITEFQLALPKIHAPGLNVMYGDAKGNVAWWATAKLYQMPDSVSTKFILDGTNGIQEPLRYLDFSENPQSINPPQNYVYSANNQPDSIAGMVYPGYYLPENRAKRIVELLDAKDDWDKASVSEMILDITSSVNPELVTDMIKLIDISGFNEQQLILMDELKNWKGDYPKESISATFYHRCEYFVLKNTFEDELGKEQFEQFLSTHLVKRHIAWGVKMDDGVWWDNVKTEDIVETKGDIALKSLQDAWTSLINDFGEDTMQWQWGKVHTLEHGHPIGRVDALRKYFNAGPFPVHGSREVINNMAFPYDSTGLYKVNSGPSTRRIIDFSDVENSISILPTGQSGNPLSEHYKDQAQMFVNGEFRKMMMNKEEIIEKRKSILKFLKK
ncbi:penicillin acylase family protein [Croceitalea rosinachiae]|uniref:Penicillin acylase family protein n=1 Tax=Croceitalea rosinachiae TaxID=3075596 RepID=A0ABU3AC34_9FLAO|nr:penicillin acylase family protein [Croceitalea sp. F388]MDT0607749.1 penicillin acylase family protein [Croceitalea sp. F388]